MSSKPSRVPSSSSSASGGTQAIRARGMRCYGNPEHMRAAIELDVQDRRAGLPHAGRYTRIVQALTERFGCSESAAKRAIQGMRAYNQALLEERQPTLVAELVDQHQDIADRAAAAGEFTPAVAALREIGKLVGVYAPKRVEVEHTEEVTVQFELRAVIDVLSPQGQAALELVLQEIEEAKAAGRLALPAPIETCDDDGGDDPIRDAEVVEPDKVN